ncbi:MAG: ABC transporter ATP-binding protein [Myxococcales bacterium]|nr:ABC transporter ATP-binding protein [Myxococcales bacterium]
MAEAWIELENVSVRRSGRPVLVDISAAMRGKAVGLVGANGSGKSTLIGTLLGVLRAESGVVRVLGYRLPEMAMEVRARAGVMAEQAGIFPGGSGVDAVAFAGMLSGLGRSDALRRAHRALDALAVGEERYRSTSGFSTGMKQRCKLAMSLVQDPEILILDEPTIGLDPPGRVQLLGLIRDLRDQGRRILMSTHIMADAEVVCDEMLLLSEGTVAYHGTKQQLTGSTGGPISAEGYGIDATFAALLTSYGVVVTKVRPNGVMFVANDDSHWRAFWRVVAERHAEVRSLGPELASLEDAVVHMMEGTEHHGT